MTEFLSRIKCDCCEWVFKSDDALVGKNPFEPNLTVYGCPNCKEIEDFVVLCDVATCHEKATCGSPVGEDYHQLCGKHFRELGVPS
jgi:hypothetical protein